MKIRCTYRIGDPIPSDVVALGNTPSTRFDVQYGRDYVVYSIALWSGVIHYLVLNDQTHRPDWFPAFLFKVLDPRLPSGWSFNMREDIACSFDAILGYAESAQVRNGHYLDLVEREESALQLFEHHRAAIDAQEHE